MTAQVQIASMISDVRLEREFSSTLDGVTSTTTVVEFPTIDDLMLHGMKVVAAEIKFSGIEYSSIQDRDLVTQLVRTQLPLVRR